MTNREVYKEPFDDVGQFLQAVAINAKSGGVEMDPRLEYTHVNNTIFGAASGLNEFVPSEGGFLVPPEFALDIWQRTYDVGVILSRCDRQPVTRNALDIPAVHEDSRANGSRFGSLAMTWLQEADLATASKPKWRSMKLAPKKLLGLAYITEELLRDRPALEAWFRRSFALEASFAIEDRIISGDGAKAPLGVLSAGSLITVDKASGQGAATAVAANFTAMMQRMWGPSRRNAVWLTCNDLMTQAEGLSFSNGKPVVEYDQDGVPRILGRPVELCEYTSQLGTAGDLILADFSQYLIAEIAPQFISSLHVKFLTDEATFRVRYRVDGQPAWESALTPKNSSTTQSPFVTLAARG